MKRALFLALGLLGLASADGTFQVSGTSIEPSCPFEHPLLPQSCLSIFEPMRPPNGSVTPVAPPLSLQDDATNLLVRDAEGNIISRTLYLNELDLQRIKDFNKP